MVTNSSIGLHLRRRGFVDAVAAVLAVTPLTGEQSPIVLVLQARLGLRVAQRDPGAAVVGQDVGLLAGHALAPIPAIERHRHTFGDLAAATLDRDGALAVVVDLDT